jgi:hypothetical protein
MPGIVMQEQTNDGVQRVGGNEKGKFPVSKLEIKSLKCAWITISATLIWRKKPCSP